MIQKMEHIGIAVHDMDTSIRFYTEVHGLSLVDRAILDDGVELGFLSYPASDTIQIELIGKGQIDLPSQGRVDHLAFTVTDIELEVERIKKLGVRLIDETPRTILGGIKIAFFYGPDGEQLELFQPH